MPMGVFSLSLSVTLAKCIANLKTVNFWLMLVICSPIVFIVIR